MPLVAENESRPPPVMDDVAEVPLVSSSVATWTLEQPSHATHYAPVAELAECSWCLEQCGGAGSAGVFECEQCSSTWHEHHFTDVKSKPFCVLCAPPRTGFPGKNKTCHQCKNAALPSARHDVWVCPTPRCPFVYHMRHFRGGLEPHCLRCTKKCCCAFPGSHSDDADYCCAPDGRRLINCASCADRRTRKASSALKAKKMKHESKEEASTPAGMEWEIGSQAGGPPATETTLVVPSRFDPLIGASTATLTTPAVHATTDVVNAEREEEGGGQRGEGAERKDGILHQDSNASDNHVRTVNDDNNCSTTRLFGYHKQPDTMQPHVLEMRQAAMKGVVDSWRDGVLEAPFNLLHPEHLWSGIASIMNSGQLANIAAKAFPGNVHQIIDIVRPNLHHCSPSEVSFTVAEVTETGKTTGQFSPTHVTIDGENFNEQVITGVLLSHAGQTVPLLSWQMSSSFQLLAFLPAVTCTFSGEAPPWSLALQTCYGQLSNLVPVNVQMSHNSNVFETNETYSGNWADALPTDDY